MTTNFGLLLGAATALFLVGINLAFLLQLGSRLVPWFRFKIAAVTLIFGYVCLSFTYGGPAGPRVFVGWAALVLDMVAVFWMWFSIETTRERGVIGLVPLIKAKGEKGDPGERGPAGPAGPPGEREPRGHSAA